jgi:hypothetical protein
MGERDRLIGIAVLTLVSVAIAGFALILELEGGDGGRLGMFAGAPLLAAVLLAALGGRRR